jgi:hypothetical protein
VVSILAPAAPVGNRDVDFTASAAHSCFACLAHVSSRVDKPLLRAESHAARDRIRLRPTGRLASASATEGAQWSLSMAAVRWTSEPPTLVRVRLRRHARTIVPASVSSDPQPGPLLLALKAACLRHMIEQLPPDPTTMLPQLDFRSLHQVFTAWRGRVPQARPRRVYISSDLLDNHDRLAYSAGLVAALSEIAHGHDLRPRTSTAIEHAYTPWTPPLLARGRPGQRHVDRLLADWGLHHLHLGTTPHPKRPEFVSRTRHVRFVAFKPEDAYLVDVAEHESDGANWSALKLLEIVVRNWPDAGILVASTFAVGLTNGNWSDEDRRALRRAGISTGAV